MRTILAILFSLATAAAAPAQEICRTFNPDCDDLLCRQGGPPGSEKYQTCRKLRAQFNAAAERINAGIIKHAQPSDADVVYAPLHEVEQMAFLYGYDPKECLDVKLELVGIVGNIYIRIADRAKEMVNKFGIGAMPYFEADASKQVAEISQKLKEQYSVLLTAACLGDSVPH